MLFPGAADSVHYDNKGELSTLSICVFGGGAVGQYLAGMLIRPMHGTRRHRTYRAFLLVAILSRGVGQWLKHLQFEWCPMLAPPSHQTGNVQIPRTSRSQNDLLMYLMKHVLHIPKALSVSRVLTSLRQVFRTGSEQQRPCRSLQRSCRIFSVM